MHSNIDDLFSALSEATQVALREMAGIECAPIEPNELPPVELCAVLPVATAAGVGYLALALSEAIAAQLASRMLAPSEPPDPAMVRDCAGEFINVIAGQAKTRLRDTPHHFTLATPRIETSAPADAALVLAFGSEVGAIELHAKLPV